MLETVDGVTVEGSALSADDRARLVAALTESRRRGDDAVAVAAYLDGELVLEARTGSAVPGGDRPVDADTLYNVFSVSKAVTATALHVLAARGLVDYRQTIAYYWPAFGTHGKDGITIEQLLSHRAGMPWMPEGVTPERQHDWDWMVAAIEDIAPPFEPGTMNCYHALVWGWIVGELVRLVDPAHRRFEDFVREEIFAPLGLRDSFFGLPPEHDARRAELAGCLVPDGAPDEHLLGMPASVYPGSVAYNAEIALRTVNPGAGLVTTPRDLARFFAMLAGRGQLDGVRILPAELVERFLTPREHTEDTDLYLGGPARVGAYGFWLGGPGGHLLVGENPQILHHPGAGGSIGWAELDARLAVAICHNVMLSGPTTAEDHPFVPIVEAVRAIAGKGRARSGDVVG